MRTQFLVKVCFVITVSKAQGKSFNGAVGLDLSDTVFSYGQWYVVFSAVAQPGKPRVCRPMNSDKKRKNICYPEPSA